MEKLANEVPRGTRFTKTFPACFRCSKASNQWFDGPGAAQRRAVCAVCEHADWKATIRSLNVEIG